MRFPKRIRTYCRRCGTHTEHRVSQYKGGKRRSMALGERRYRRKQEGYGSKRRPEQKRFAKVTKKQVVVISCTECGMKRPFLGIRLKRLELVDIVR
ncbi:MAG: 50S ribosomal protein L44e [Aeropyrum sp.]|nr:50S ribosomal protein L44e [Aeropyrum sp.]MCE4616140.1 50S ribosomal protein L44e [Aeropyrum sp.]